MRPDLNESLDLLDKFPAAAKQAILDAHGEQELADVLGTLNSVEQRVAEQRRLASTEIQIGETGERWKDERSGKNAYSFNLPLLMTEMQANGVPLLDLIEAGCFAMDLKISRLETGETAATRTNSNPDVSAKSTYSRRVLSLPPSIT